MLEDHECWIVCLDGLNCFFHLKAYRFSPLPVTSAIEQLTSSGGALDKYCFSVVVEFNHLMQS